MLHGSSNNCSSNKIYQIYNYYDWAFILRLVDAYSNIHIQCFATLIAPFIYPTDFFSLASRNIHCISIFALFQMYHSLKFYVIWMLLILTVKSPNLTESMRWVGRSGGWTGLGSSSQNNFAHRLFCWEVRTV